MEKRDSDIWPIAEAKAKLSEVIARAVQEGPQTITRNGRPTAVVVSAEEWKVKTQRKESFVEFMSKSPLRGSGIKIERAKGFAKPIDL